MKLTPKLALAGACLAALIAGSPTSAVAAGPRSPDHGELIAFAAGIDGHSQLFTIRPDGSGLRQITHGDVNYGNPEWSPDGRLITFDADDGTTGWLSIAWPDGSHVRRLPTLGAGVGQPAFSADGRRLFFERWNGVDEDEIYSVRLDGSDLHRVTNPVAQHGVTDPQASPDGRFLSFLRLADPGIEAGPSALFVRDLRTGRETQLTTYADDVAAKQGWSPDSRHIGYTFDGYNRPPGHNSNIHITDPKDRHDRAVTSYADGTTQAFFGSYSPDGRRIVLRLEENDGYRLVTMRPNGTHPATIFAVPDLVPHFIAWGPATSPKRHQRG